MQRKAYVTGAAACLVVLLAGCSSGTGTGAAPDDSKPSDATESATPAPPGKYRTLPEACSQVDPSMLDSLLPGIKAITDVKQRERAYEGTATITYDNDRRVGCQWTGESPYATDHLAIDFERVVSYDTTVSDDTRAQEIFVSKARAAGIENLGSPSPSTSGSGKKADGGLAPDSAPGGERVPGQLESGSCVNPLSGGSGSPDASAAGKDKDGADDAGSDGAQEASDDTPPSRPLEGLGDAAFLNDLCAAPSSAALHRTVTVVFRTSNVIVTVEYDEQPSRIYDVPDGKKMQDTAQDLAHALAGNLGD